MGQRIVGDCRDMAGSEINRLSTAFGMAICSDAKARSWASTLPERSIGPASSIIVCKHSGSMPAAWPLHSGQKKKGHIISNVTPWVLVVAVDPGSSPSKCKPASTRYGPAEGCAKVLTPTPSPSPSAIFRIFLILSFTPEQGRFTGMATSNK